MALETLTWISFVVAIISILLAGIAIILQVLDKPRLKISSVHPGISGSKEPNSDRWKNFISSIEIIVENRGSRPAVDCEAVITFPHIEALPLYPQTREHLIDKTNRLFSVQPKSKIRILGAWNIINGGAIDGTKNTFTLGEFLEKATPATIIISFGGKRVKHILSKERVQNIVENHQAQLYLSEIK